MVKHIRVEATDEHPDWHQKGKLWKLIRKTMLTASTAGIIHNNSSKAKNTVSLKDLNTSYTDESYTPRLSAVAKKNMEYGNNMESRAIDDYKVLMKSHYEECYPGASVSVEVNTDVNMYIHQFGLVLASPDGEVTVTVTPPEGEPIVERGVIEVKAPVGSTFVKERDWRGYLLSPARPITYTINKFLLPDNTSKNRKYGPPTFPEPRLQLGVKQTKEQLYRTQGSDANFGPDGIYSQYYFQSILNMYLSGREFVDFIVWTDATKTTAGKQHTFFYKESRSATDRFPSVHVERLYASDPHNKAAYNTILSEIRSWTERYSQALEANIDHFLDEVAGEGEEPPALPEIDSADELDCEGDEFREEGEEWAL